MRKRDRRYTDRERTQIAINQIRELHAASADARRQMETAARLRVRSSSVRSVRQLRMLSRANRLDARARALHDYQRQLVDTIITNR